VFFSHCGGRKKTDPRQKKIDYAEAIRGMGEQRESGKRNALLRTFIRLEQPDRKKEEHL